MRQLAHRFSNDTPSNSVRLSYRPWVNLLNIFLEEISLTFAKMLKENGPQNILEEKLKKSSQMYLCMLKALKADFIKCKTQISEWKIMLVPFSIIHLIILPDQLISADY